MSSAVVLASLSAPLSQLRAVMPRPTGLTAKRRSRRALRRQKKLESAANEPIASSSAPAEEQLSTSLLVEAPVASRRTSHAELAQLLWSSDYVGLFLNELTQYEEVAVCELVVCQLALVTAIDQLVRTR